MTPVKTAGIAAIGAAVTYLVGFVVLLGVLNPAGYGFALGEEANAIAFLARYAGVMTAWNSVVYIANAVLVGVLVIALYEMGAPLSPRLMRVASAFGLVWVGLLLAAGMVANSAIVAIALISGSELDQAIAVWRVFRIVENGLGGGNEIAGALWLGISMVAATSLPA